MSKYNITGPPASDRVGAREAPHPFKYGEGKVPGAPGGGTPRVPTSRRRGPNTLNTVKHNTQTQTHTHTPRTHREVMRHSVKGAYASGDTTQDFRSRFTDYRLIQNITPNLLPSFLLRMHISSQLLMK